MKITILTDNKANPNNSKLNSQHGFSAYIEFDYLKILCDTGCSQLFLENSKALGIDISKIDFAVISHGHKDHCGAIGALSKVTNAPIYHSEKIFSERYFSSRGGIRHEISAEIPVIINYNKIVKNLWITDKIAMVSCSSNHYPTPEGNSALSVMDKDGERSDNFTHEYALVFIENNSLVILSPCSHRGVLNIIESCREFTKITDIKAFIGGMHFTDGDHTEREVTKFKESIPPKTRFITGHCTCPRAAEILSNKVEIFYTGAVIEL